MALLNCVDVAIEYGDRLVFSDMNLKIEPGDRLGIVGANGAGKSSFLGLLAALEQPSAGRVERQGRLIDHDQSGSMERKKQEGYF